MLYSAISIKLHGPHLLTTDFLMSILSVDDIKKCLQMKVVPDQSIWSFIGALLTSGILFAKHREWRNILSREVVEVFFLKSSHFFFNLCSLINCAAGLITSSWAWYVTGWHLSNAISAIGSPIGHACLQKCWTCHQRAVNHPNSGVDRSIDWVLGFIL